MLSVGFVILLRVMMAMDTLAAKAIGPLVLALADPAVSSFAERQRRHDDIAAARLAQVAWRRRSRKDRAVRVRECEVEVGTGGPEAE